MKTTPLTILAAIAALSTSALAGEYSQPEPAPFESVSIYNGGEFQLDIFGSYAFADEDGGSIIQDGTVGGGAGFTYYLTRNIGIGAEGSFFDTDGDTFGSTATNLYLRAPIGDSGLALYGFGGVGLLFNAEKIGDDDFDDVTDDLLFEAHVGIGVEYRMSEHFGIFSDLRYNFVEGDDRDFAAARAGLRITF